MPQTIPELPRYLLGEILFNRGVISQDQLRQALAIQKEKGGYLGQHLISLGYVEEKDVIVALIVQCNIPYIAIDKYNVDVNIVYMIPPEFAREKKVVALDRVGNIFSVVMADPLDQGVKAEIQRITNCQVAPFIATEAEITNAINRFYKQGA